MSKRVKKIGYTDVAVFLKGNPDAICFEVRVSKKEMAKMYIDSLKDTAEKDALLEAFDVDGQQFIIRKSEVASIVLSTPEICQEDDEEDYEEYDNTTSETPQSEAYTETYAEDVEEEMPNSVLSNAILNGIEAEDEDL